MSQRNLRARYQRRERQLRSRYRVLIVIMVILGLALGFVAGWFGHTYLAGDKLDEKTPGVDLDVTPSPTPAPWNDPPIDETDSPPDILSFDSFNPAQTDESTIERETDSPTIAPAVSPTSEPTSEPSVEPTSEPTPELTPEPIAEPVKGSRGNPVLMGEKFSFTAEINTEGSMRTPEDVGGSSIMVELTLARYMDLDYYVSKYSTSYKLRGDEAGSELIVDIGKHARLDEFSFQNAVTIVYETAEGDIIQGFQLTDAEIDGKTNSDVATGAQTKLYKRFRFDPNLNYAYLTVTYFANGEQHKIYYSLTESAIPEPDPDATPEPAVTYKSGDSGEEVRKMQRKLIDLGYLEGVADGQFGQMTKTAVSKAQTDFGLTPTGEADPAFLEILWAK